MRKPSPLSSRTSSLLTLSFLSSVSLGLVACGGDDAPTAAEVRARLTTDLAHVLQQSTAAGEGGSRALESAAALGMLERVLGTTGGSVVPRVRSGLAGLVGSSDTRSGVLPEDEEVEPVDELIHELTTKLFTDANDLGDGIFKVPAELVCTTETFNDDGTTTATLDPECAQQLADSELRIRASIDGDELRLAVQVAANHDEPLVLALSHTSLAATLDLDEAGQALTALAPIFGDDIPNTSLSGQVTSRIDILGTAKAKLALSIDRALSIKFADAGVDLNSAQAFRFTSAVADVASITLDGPAQSGSLVFGLGETTAHVADDQVVDVDLPGITAAATFAAGQPLQLTNLGLGGRTTTVSIDGAQAVGVDLNPADGRAFGATISTDAVTGESTLAVTPRFDLRIALDHAALGDERPTYDVTQVRLDGSLRGSEQTNEIEVVTGTFAITTDPASFGFSASTGQCVSSTDVETDGDFYTQWTAGTCE